MPGAVLARVASSHLRVGTFQYARATGELDLLRRLADHAISRHHPGAAGAEHPYLALFEAVVAALGAGGGLSRRPTAWATPPPPRSPLR